MCGNSSSQYRKEIRIQSTREKNQVGVKYWFINYRVNRDPGILARAVNMVCL